MCKMKSDNKDDSSPLINTARTIYDVILVCVIGLNNTLPHRNAVGQERCGTIRVVRISQIDPTSSVDGFGVRGRSGGDDACVKHPVPCDNVIRYILMEGYTHVTYHWD